MTCNFQIEIPENIEIETLIEKGKEAFAQMNGEFNGDANGGDFTLDSPVGKISGKYIIADGKMEVELTEKPMMLPCSLIEGEFNRYLKG